MKIMLSLLLALLVSCTTLDQSMKLGAATGVLAGATATYGAYGAVGRPASAGEIGLGASSDHCPQWSSSPSSVISNVFRIPIELYRIAEWTLLSTALEAKNEDIR